MKMEHPMIQEILDAKSKLDQWSAIKKRIVKAEVDSVHSDSESRKKKIEAGFGMHKEDHVDPTL